MVPVGTSTDWNIMSLLQGAALAYLACMLIAALVLFIPFSGPSLAARLIHFYPGAEGIATVILSVVLGPVFLLTMLVRAVYERLLGHVKSTK